MSSGVSVPETCVLAIASHVVYGYVGNRMAALILQSLGCEVAALNTVQYSNHTAYKQTKGTKATAQEIRDLYEGLKQSYLDDFDVLLSGYIPGAESVTTVGAIAKELKLKSVDKPGSFFWVLDPVMGDQGSLYVDKDVVPAYKHLLRDADLVLPNQFELELLSDKKVDSLQTLAAAVTALHHTYQVPHVVVTSVRLDQSSPTISVVGSTNRSDGSARLFKIDVPYIDCFFSGTGDMFAALTVARLRQAVAGVDGLSTMKGWLSPDDVQPTALPLAKAVELVLGSMQAVLSKTKEAMDKTLATSADESEVGYDSEKRMHLRRTKAAEVRLVKHLEDLKTPRVEHFAEALRL